MDEVIQFGKVEQSSPQTSLRPDRSEPRPQKNSISRQTLIVCTGVAMLIGGLGVFFGVLSASQVTTSAESPDGQYRAELLDRKARLIDRNFRVQIVDATGGSQVVFRSPDESPMKIGQERFLWSQDGTRLLLVSRGFWTRKGCELTSGESLYFLYDLPSGQVWCNSDQRGPPFDLAELKDHDFGEALDLKP